MKKFIPIVLCCALSVSSPRLHADDLQQTETDTEEIWRTGSGSEDGVFTSVSLSMLGWGLGLAAAIAILVTVIHSQGSSSQD